MIGLGRRTYLLYRHYLRAGRTPSMVYGGKPNEWDEAFVFAAERYAVAEEAGHDPDPDAPRAEV